MTPWPAPSGRPAAGPAPLPPPLGGGTGLRYLPGLDGLRVVAVVAVLLFHGDMSWLPGGYLGVEVFFVISGYLITTLLLQEHRSTGSLRLRGFWTRRARRLLPALYLLLAVVAVGMVVAYSRGLAELRGQLVAALTYCTNWFLIVVQADYFDVIGRPPVLQHLWSLAVEEQFYIVWPVVLLGLLRLFRHRLVPVAVVVATLAGASALWMAVLYDPIDPSRAYYGTDTRASGLLLGALLAFVWRPGPAVERVRVPAALLDVAAVVALGGLGLAFARLAEWRPFLYRGGFVVVSLLTLVVIAAVAHPRSVLGRVVLGHAVLVWIGVRSYGLYLWHWPVFVFTRPGIDLSWSPVPTLGLRLAACVVLADLSYRFVEQPVRRGALGRWLAGLRGPRSAQRAVRRWLTVTSALSVGVLVIAVGVAVAGATKPVDELARALETGQVAAAPPTSNAAAVPASPGPAVPAAGEPSVGASSVSTAPGTTAAADAGLGSLGLRPAGGLVARPTSVPPSTLAPEARTMTVLADSVLLGAQDALVGELAQLGWTVDVRGRPAQMVKEATRELAEAGVPVGRVVVVALGYNSLWERDRGSYDKWSAVFDREAEELIATVQSLGAEEIYWITLRQPSPENVPAKGQTQYRKYAWYFPYVNEQLRGLDARRPDLALMDWALVSNHPGLTYDAIHLNGAGVRLMIDVIRATVGI